MKRIHKQPLIELAEGADQDDRASLRAAWRVVRRELVRRTVTDLHVRELLFFVLAKDKSRLGVQLFIREIADELECSERTARSIIDRAATEFGLLMVVEQRYVHGGQTANRYSIDWAMVHSIVRGEHRPAVIASRRGGRKQAGPPDPTGQGGDFTGQGADPTGQPNKEYTQNLTQTSSPSVPQNASPLSSPRQSPSPRPAVWGEVEDFLVGLPADRRPGSWRPALTAAQRTGVTPDHVLDVLRHYASDPTSYGPGALYQRLRHCHPQLPPDEGWVRPAVSSVSPPNRSPAADLAAIVGRVEFSICRSRTSADTDDDIRSRIAAELSRLRIDPRHSAWCRNMQPAES